MSQGEFTKEEADAVSKMVWEMYGAMSKRKQMEWLGAMNDIELFIKAAQRVAPNEKE